MNIVENAVERIHLPAGLVLNVRPSTPGAIGTIALASGNVSLAATSTSGSSPATVGPFSVPVDLIVSAQGAVSAEVQPLTAAQAQAVRRSSLLSGEAPQRVFLLGDSLAMRSFRAIAAGSTTVLNATDVEIALGSGTSLPPIGSFVRVINQADTALNIDVPVVGSGTNSTIIRFPFAITGRVGATLSGAIYGISNDTGWWNYAEGELAALGYPVQVVRNAGDGGDTLAQIRARIASEIAPYAQPGDLVVFMGGVNGAGTGSDDSLDESTADAVVSQLGLIIDDLLALGVTVCASTITQAQASGYWATSAATAIANTKAANGYIRGRAQSEARMRCFDSYAALGGGDYAAGDVDSAGIHLLPSGAEKVGQRFVDDCIGVFRKGSFRRVLSAADAYVDSSSWNLLVNPAFTGATGTTAPTGWTASLGAGTNSLTLSARADGTGNDLTISKAHTASNAGSLTQVMTDRIAAGQRLAFGIEYESDTLAEGHHWRLSLEFDVDGVTYSYRINNNQFSYAQGGRLPPAGVRRFFEWYGYRNLNGREGCLVPAGFTAARLVLAWQLGASGSMSFKVARPQVYRVG